MIKLITNINQTITMLTELVLKVIITSHLGKLIQILFKKLIHLNNLKISKKILLKNRQLTIQMVL